MVGDKGSRIRLFAARPPRADMSACDRHTGAIEAGRASTRLPRNRKQDVRVVALCPGPTATNFFTILGADEVPMLSKMHTPEAVVMTGLGALEQGRPYAVEGRRNAFGAQVTHMTPLALTTRVFARVMRPRKKEATPVAAPVTG
jgi:hypothetical protein